MTASDKKTVPDFFKERHLDPVAVATGRPGVKPTMAKRKAGFYFSETLLERFNRRFHQLKIDGVPVDNKSDLAEMALHFALDDLDQGAVSRLLQRIRGR